ncbi:MAG: protoheme IX farnesyltransferase [Ignavibacteria bacterium]|nr:protoheme IX farnesyltransferase [Ignavibacteria bacterium]
MKKSTVNINSVEANLSRQHYIVAGSFAKLLNLISELVKFKITALVSFTTGLGYILATNKLGFTLFWVIGGIFLLAAASSVLNHWQERDTDALMDRTKYRPIPSGRIEPKFALYISMFLLFSGSVLLITTTNLTALLVGLFTFLWYNGVYTPLKRKTAFAIIPGALVGALPPVAGWAAAGGNILDSRIIIIAAYFFIWQIPHFWLLLILYGNDYEKGGFPTLNKIFSELQLKRITFNWLIVNVLTAMLIPMFIYINYTVSYALLFIISAWMIWVSVKFVRSNAERKNIIKTFIAINFYTLLLISILSIDKLLKVFF